MRKALLGSLYAIVVVAIALAALEVAARRLGLGDPVLYYNDAWGGIRPLPDQQVTRAGGARVSVDANGFRSARRDTSGATRILYLGDSVTWGGSRVDDTELFSEVSADVLRAKGRTVYAMNAGVNGSSLVNQSEIFMGYRGEVDAVVWMFPWGDAMRAYATVGALWPARLKPRFALVEAVDLAIHRFWLDAFRLRERPAGAYDTPEIPLGRESSYRQILDDRVRRNVDVFFETVQEALGRGIPVVVGITPRFENGALVPLPAEAVDVLERLSAGGVHILDVAEALDASEIAVRDLFFDEVHYTPSGHAVVGAAVGAALSRALTPRIADAESGNSAP